LIIRSRETYSSCIKLYKKKQITIPKGKIYERVPNNIKIKVVQILKNEFKNGIGMKENVNIFEFIFNRKNIKNILYFSDKGICIFRLINNIDANRLIKKYKLEDIDGLYISFIVKIDKTIAGFAGHVFEEIFTKFRKHIYLEVKKTNEKAIKVYELLGFKLIGTSTNQLLYVHKGVFS
jgi:sRNA-binding carbon storage regulator CsrA